MKAVTWLGSSRRDLKSFPGQVMDDLGHQLYRVQCGLDPDDWKPMAVVGAGVREIRVTGADGAFRTLYLATRKDAVYVLHCFQKKTQKTAARDIELAKSRFKDIAR